MDSGFYAACTGLLAQTDALEITANNMAHLSPTGYKRRAGAERAQLCDSRHLIAPES